jgi:hypothetical protein
METDPGRKPRNPWASTLNPVTIYEGQDCAIQSTPKTFIIRILFIDWLEATSLQHNTELREKFVYDGPIILAVDDIRTMWLLE